MQAADTLESEEERMEAAEGNGSDEETDSDCEEEEGATQSDSGVTAEGSSGHRKALGRKRLFSETTDQLLPDTKCKQAHNLHNERERERRKDLKQAVHRLRNQLQLWKTKKATTISVLKASEQEIKALKEMENTQNTDLESLKKHNNHLTWKLERLIGEYNMNSKAEQSPVPPLMPTTILPFIPSSVPAAHPPISMARAPHPVLLPSQMTPTSQSSFPFGTPASSPFAAFQYSLLPPTPPLTLASHPHPFPPHPPPTSFPSPAPFLIMSPPPPTQPIPLSTLMPHLSPSGPTAATIPGQFPFPGTSFSPSHIPSSFTTAMPSITLSAPPSAIPMPVLQYGRKRDGYNTTGAVAAVSRRSSPPHLISVSEEASAFKRQREKASSHREESAEVTKTFTCEGSGFTGRNLQGERGGASPIQANVVQPMEEVVSESGEHIEGGTEQFIDVESTDQEEEGVWCKGTDESTSRDQHMQRGASKQERSNKARIDLSTKFPSGECSIIGPPQDTGGPKNLNSPPALVKKAGVNESNTVSQIIQRVQPATDDLTEEAFTAALKKHQQILLKHSERGCDGLHRWNNHTQEVKNTPLPRPSQRTPVICS